MQYLSPEETIRRYFLFQEIKQKKKRRRRRRKKKRRKK
jgi:hypothetical protein